MFLGHFEGSSCDWGVLRVILSYEVMKRIILVVGRVTEVFWVGFEGFIVTLGGLGGLQGGLFYLDGALFAPLEVLYSTKIGSKYHIMVQLAKPHRVRITDHCARQRQKQVVIYPKSDQICVASFPGSGFYPPSCFSIATRLSQSRERLQMSVNFFGLWSIQRQ